MAAILGESLYEAAFLFWIFIPIALGTLVWLRNERRAPPMGRGIVTRRMAVLLSDLVIVGSIIYLLVGALLPLVLWAALFRLRES